MDESGQSSLGFEENVVAVASYAYFLGFIILILEKKSNFVRFHALQSTFGFTLLTLLLIIIKCLPILSFLWWLPGLSMLLFAGTSMLKAYYGEEHKAPLVGRLAFGLVYDTRSDEGDLLAVEESEGQTENVETAGTIS
ncbi:MAG: hypothetical protein QME62_05530 [Armatimonadota bacterium]|nr:hypothetical protein [Armatimonadota bacterium]